MVCSRSVEHTRNTIQRQALEETTSQLRPMGNSMLDVEKMSTRQHGSARSVARLTVAAPDPTVRIMTLPDHTSENTAPKMDAQDAKGIEAGRSMPHNNECRMISKARMEQSEEGREGLRKEEQRQDRHLEKVVMRSVEEDLELRRAEEGHKRKLVEIENDGGTRGSEAKGE